MTSLEERYARNWPGARATYARASTVLPGGNTRTQTHVSPFPLYAARAQGARIELSDGVELDDFLLNYSASAVGHRHPAVTEALHRAIEEGGPFGLPTDVEVEFAQAIRDRFTGVELVRFTNSGSEATLQAVRAARAFTGRTHIAKAEGGYHGSHDLLDVGVTRFGEHTIEAIGETAGTTAAAVAGTVVFPYNDLERAIAELQPRAAELAAVVIEVFLNAAGVIPGETEFLQGIGRWCREHAVLLVLDEVASWRTGYRGAAAEHHGLEPDLICLGKALGGGIPIGAVGGREEVVSMFDPRRPDVVRHAGTFNGHPAAMSAGLAVLAALDERSIAIVNEQASTIADGVGAIADADGLPLAATHYGGVGRLHVSASEPRSARESLALPREPRVALYRALLERGILVSPDGRFSTCTATTDAQVRRFLSAFREAASEVFNEEEEHV